MNLPEQYLENMKELLGTDFDAYIESFNDSRLHHEIYLSDPRKTEPARWKTVIRHPIKIK